jgi:hypothetical protein
LLEGAAKEDDDFLTEKWAALLANAAADASEANVIPSYVKLLEQLTPNQADFFEHVCASTDAIPRTDGKMLRVTSAIIGGISFDGQPASEEEIHFEADNLVRLGLISGNGEHGTPIHGRRPGDQRVGGTGIYATRFGLRFFRACQPPKNVADK